MPYLWIQNNPSMVPVQGETLLARIDQGIGGPGTHRHVRTPAGKR